MKLLIALTILLVGTVQLSGEPNQGAKMPKRTTEQQPTSTTVTTVNNNTCPGDTDRTNGRPPRWYSSPEWWLAILGFPTLFMLGWQANEMRRATIAAKNSAEATQKSVEIQGVNLRQWIDIDNWKALLYKPEGGALGLHVQFDVVNPTNLPLTLNSVYVTFSCHGCVDQGNEIGRKNLVPPRKGQPVVTWVKLTEEQLIKWEDLKELFFAINGTVEFEDVLKEVRTQPFSGSITYSKKSGIRFIPSYGSGVYITDTEKKNGEPG